MSLSGIIHHSHSFTRLEIYHHIYFTKIILISPDFIVLNSFIYAHCISLFMIFQMLNKLIMIDGCLEFS